MMFYSILVCLILTLSQTIVSKSFGSVLVNRAGNNGYDNAKQNDTAQHRD